MHFTIQIEYLCFLQNILRQNLWCPLGGSHWVILNNESADTFLVFAEELNILLLNYLDDGVKSR